MARVEEHAQRTELTNLTGQSRERGSERVERDHVVVVVESAQEPAQIEELREYGPRLGDDDVAAVDLGGDDNTDSGIIARDRRGELRSARSESAGPTTSTPR